MMMKHDFAVRKPIKFSHGVSTVATLAAVAFSASAQAQEASAIEPAQTPGDTARVLGQRDDSKPLATITRDENDIAVDVRVDSRMVAPLLNATIDAGEARLVGAGETLRVNTYWNYSAFIKRGEIRLFEAGQSQADAPRKVIPLDARNGADLALGDGDPDAMFFVLRVYGDQDRFDETRPRELSLVAAAAKPSDASQDTLFGRDNTASRNIDIRGSSVTVTGKAEGRDAVQVMGQIARFAKDGSFSVQEIVPYGTSDIDVKGIKAGDVSSSFAQSVHIPRSDWFAVGIGDVTLGTNKTSGAGLATGADPEFDKLYNSTRGAFYAKGLIAGRTQITASLDTGETSFKKVFSNLNDKDPAQLLRRLDSTQYLPTYGDDSTTVEDAPTQGRFYLRVDRDQSKFVLGNYIVDVYGTDLAQLDRGLYGAMGDFKSKGLTSFGEAKSRVTVFASDPGTIPGREEFRGTGGSAYFLQRQDLSIGSERVRVEVRDKDSGIVLETRELRALEDYDIDYIQGRILLTRPLASTAADGQTVRSGNLSGHQAVLVVRYEYTPTVTDLGGYTLGGRSTTWLGNVVRLGATAQREATGEADQKLVGADILVRKSDTTFLRAEIARTEGPAFSQALSVDGGLNFTTVGNPGRLGQPSMSWKVQSALKFSDLGARAEGFGKGNVTAYYEHLDGGFTGIGRLTNDAVNRWGGKALLPLTSSTELSFDYDELVSTTLGRNRSVDVGVNQKFGKKLKGNFAFRHEKRQPVSFLPSIVESGARNDLAVQLDYEPAKGVGLFAFGQTTLSRDGGRSGNDRAGIGGRYEVSNRMSLNGEVSTGEGGMGATVGLTRRIGNNSETYLNYSISADRSDSGFEAQSLLTRSNFGTLTIGGKTRIGNNLSLHGEERVARGTGSREFVHSYGMEFTPGRQWTLATTFEKGTITDANTGSFNRTALTGSVGYSSEGVRFASSLEARFEKGVGRKNNIWLTRTTVGIDLNPSWRALGRLNFAIADADQSSILDAGFVEGVFGFAYRPVNNNRLNALVKFTYLKDTATFDQFTGSGTTQSPKQRSQIVSADFTYKLKPWLSIGGKYGYRFGEVALSRGSDQFVSSNTHLGIVRADLHVVKKWDVMAEGRYLSSPSASDKKLGLLVGVYRELGNNLRIGVGYNFSRYSDDLADQSNRNRGAFFNIVGKY